MKKIIIIFIIAFGYLSNANNNLNYIETCFKTTCFTSRIADNPMSRTKGLMNEDYLPQNEGLLFIFPTNDIHEFWMKNMKFPIDIIFINDENIITYIIKNAPVCKGTCDVYKPTRKSIMVLEVNAGMAEKHGIHVGQEVAYYIEDER